MKLERGGRARLAGAIWIVVGLMLLARGYPYWARLSGLGSQLAIPLLALVVGGAKGWFVLRKASRRNLDRMAAQPGPQGFWTIYPGYLYALIPVMIGFGVSVRYLCGESAPWVVVLVYFGVGSALLGSAPPYFLAAKS